jgi:hypothetical protein
MYNLSSLSYGSDNRLTRIKTQYQTMFPQKKTNTFLNKLGLSPMTDYHKMGDKYMYGWDSRMVDARGLRLELDQPAKIGAINMNDVYKIDNKGYGGVYNTYSDINNGNVVYYVDQSISQPFFDPVYTLSANVEKNILLDPMNNPKPDYKKNVQSTLYGVVNDQYARDQLSFREELMSRQQNLYNRTSWTNRWISPKI